MDLVWIYPDNGSVLFVQLGNLPRVPSTLDDIIVEFVSERQRCKLWAGERGDGTQIQTVYGYIQRVKGNEDSEDFDQRDCIHFTPNASRDNCIATTKKERGNEKDDAAVTTPPPPPYHCSYFGACWCISLGKPQSAFGLLQICLANHSLPDLTRIYVGLAFQDLPQIL